MAMQSPLQGLNVPLYRRNWSRLRLVAGCIFVGWLWHRPTELRQIAASCMLGGLAVWFFMASPIVWHFATHRVPVIRGITVALAVFGLVEFMRSVIPYVHRLVQ